MIMQEGSTMGRTHKVTGVIHLPPFGAGRTEIDKLERWLLEQMSLHVEGGFDSMMIQDQTPGERAGLKTVTVLAALGRAVKRTFPQLSLGIILEANDPAAALHVANACGADFVRQKVFIGAMVKAGGLITGCAAEAWKARQELDRPVKIFTDIYDRTGVPLGPLPVEVAAGQALKYGSDGLILTGKDFSETLEMADRVKSRFPNAAVYLGGGITEANAEEALGHSDGMIVSSCLMKAGKENEWDGEKIRRFMGIVKEGEGE